MSAECCACHQLVHADPRIDQTHRADTTTFSLRCRGLGLAAPQVTARLIVVSRGLVEACSARTHFVFTHNVKRLRGRRSLSSPAPFANRCNHAARSAQPQLQSVVRAWCERAERNCYEKRVGRSVQRACALRLHTRCQATTWSG